MREQVFQSFLLLLSLLFDALWTDSGAPFLFQTVQTRLVFFLFLCQHPRAVSGLASGEHT